METTEKNQPQAPLTTGRHYVRASSRFARRLWCRMFNHRWNIHSLGRPEDDGTGTYWRTITHQECRRCGEPGPVQERTVWAR